MTGEENEAPELESFFCEMNRVSALNYCVVCLRTEKERTLVHSKSLKRFAAAVKIDNKWQNHHTCYICERQAANAFKFFKAAAFASAINRMFEDLVFWKRKSFVKKKFINALKKISKDTNFTHPCDWEAQLQEIRKRTQMSWTEPLVIDNRGVKLKPTLTDEVFVIPDDEPDIGLVTSTATRSCGLMELSGATPHLAGWKRQPDRHGTNKGQTRDDSLELTSSEPKVSETFVILEDEDEKDPLQIQIQDFQSEKDHRQPNLQPKVPTSVPKLDDSVPQPALNMVPLEKLLERPKAPEKSLLTANNAHENIILHPIILNDGILTVPSLSATIVNGVLTVQSKTDPVNNHMFKKLIQNPAKDISLPSTDMMCQTNIPKIYPKPNHNQEDLMKNKRDSDFMFATPSKKVKGLPVIESVTSEAVKSGRIDWEDKIPMEVISFVDAVDPNRPKFLESTTTPTAVQSGVAPQMLCTPTPVDPNVIDLC